MRHERSKDLFDKAITFIPGGVSSPVRAFKAVGGDPIFITRGEGPYIFDADGNRYIDYVCSWGPLILGHAHPAVIEAITRTARDGTSFGWATGREVELAERVVQHVPSVDMVRFVNSGTEATMSALRVARGATKRDRVVKFAGCYHGHADAWLSESAGSGVATLGIPGTAGVPKGAAQDTITLRYNDLESVRATFAEMGSTIAAIIVEPVVGNMGLVPPVDGFLQGLRDVCDQHGTLLIFDEVMTGFRLGLAGAQGLYNVRADLTTFGKVIGGGLPVGAYGGRRELMQHVAPVGPVYQAGTLSGNPLAMAAGIATLDAIAVPGFFERLNARTAELGRAITAVLDKHGKPARFDHVGSMTGLYFLPGAEKPPRDYDEVKKAKTDRFGVLYRALLDQGVALAPSAFEAGFVSAAHEQTHVEATAAALDEALTLTRG